MHFDPIAYDVDDDGLDYPARTRDLHRVKVLEQAADRRAHQRQGQISARIVRRLPPGTWRAAPPR
jgi:hypothetical protein